MNVILATDLGMCFGVRDALARAATAPHPEQITLYGELVHNRQVVDGLAARGFAVTPEDRRGPLPATPRVLITAHGISQRERHRLLAAGKTLIDTTCPLVRRVQAAAQQLQRAGYFVVVIGNLHHVEVRGIIEDLDWFTVVERPDEVRPYGVSRLGLVCQSTTPSAQAEEIRRAIGACNPGTEIRFVDTICAPTKARQEAALALIERVEVLVVVGGRNSSNTRHLVELARWRGRPAFHVEGAADLDRDQLALYSVVGLTAGTSTPDATIEAVHRELLALDAPAPDAVGVLVLVGRWLAATLEISARRWRSAKLPLGHHQ